MKRIKVHFLVLSVLVAVVIILSNAPVQAADKPIELRFAHMYPVGSPSHQLIDAWAKKIAADSNGRLTIRIFPVSTLIPAPELYDAAAKGTTDISFGNRFPPKGYTVGVTFPFLMGAPDTVTASRVYDDVWKKFPKVMADEWKDVKILWFSTMIPLGIASRKPVRTLEDMKGLQIRVPSKEISDLMRELGASPVFMSPADFIIAIEKGTVDAGTLIAGAVQDNKLGGIVKYFLDVNFGIPTPVMVVMNKDTFSRLPADLQGVIDRSCDFGKEGGIRIWVEAREAALKYFKAEGVELVRLSPEDAARWLAIINRARDRVGADLDAKGYPGTEIVRFIRERVEHHAR